MSLSKTPLKNCKNNLRQGNVGLGIAISYFTSLGYIVSIPLNDIQDYDLVIDIGECELRKVQVKTTRKIENGSYRVELSQSKKSFQENGSDYLFVVDGEGIMYLIPKESVKAKKAIALGNNYSRFIV